MDFLQWGMLWGALAVSVPLLIHLIQRRKSRPLAFPAIDFILRSRKAVAKRFRLKQLLLLALRCALVGAVAVAAARPLFPGRDAAIGPSGGPAAVAIAIDTSLSMRARSGSGTAFDAAKQAALALVNSLGPDVEGVIVPFGSDARAIPSAPTADKTQLAAAIEKLEVTFERSDIARAFDTAAQTLAGSEKPRKLVYVLTDAAAPGWGQIGTRDKEQKIGWRVIDVTEAARANTAAAALTIVEEGAGATARVDVVSFGEAGDTPAPFSTSVELFVNDSPAGRNFIEGQSGTDASTTFTLGAPTAGLNVAVARIGADALAEDDARHAVFQGRGRLRTLLVDGDPRTTMRDAETFYLERALAPGRAGASALAPVVVDSEGLVRANLSQYDVVVLANVMNLPSPTINGLKRWVQNGGGLLVTMGDRVEADIANLELGELLAMRLRGSRTAVAPRSEGGVPVAPSAAGEARELTLGPVPGRHPVTDTLDTTSEDVLGGTHFRTTELLEGGAESTTILKFSDGSPALVEKPLGRGRVALFASSIDRDWNDLPIATVYLPLMRRLVHYLAGDLGEDEAVDVLVGQSVSIETGELKNVRVDGPEGFTAQVLPAIDGAVEVTPPLPGVYRFSRDDGTPDERLIAKSFAANVDIAESDLRKVSAGELSRIFPEGVDYVGSGGLEGSGGGSSSGKSVPDQPMWGLLLGLGLLVLAMEGVVTGL